MTENASPPDFPNITHPFAFVISVEGAKVTAVISADFSQATNNQKSTEIQIGGLIKIPTSKTVAFGMITSLSVPNPTTGSPTSSDTRVVKIELMGESNGRSTASAEMQFQRGVSIYPALWAPIYLASNEDLARIYARPNEASIRIGTLHQDTTIPAYMLMDKMLGMHFAVLGNTGSGKSCTITLLLRTILQSHPQGRILLLDPHSEYASAFTDVAEVMNTATLQLPYWVFNLEEMQEIFIDKHSESYERETSLLQEAITRAKILYNKERMDINSITVDSPVPYQMRDVTRFLQEKMGELEKPDGIGPYLRLQTRIQQIKSDKRYQFMFPGLVVDDTFSAMIARLMRLPVSGKPITIFDLSAVPAEIVDVVVSVICRIIFDFAVWAHGMNVSAPLLLVCEEAHRYVPRDEKQGFAPTRRLISRVAQEGRKYGIGLGLITQRPSQISETILSQCNTLIALRMNNEADQDFVKKAVPESALGILDSLPALRRQEAIISGEGVNLPMRIRFANLPDAKRPKSDTASFSEEWAYDNWTLAQVDEVIELWRRQRKENVL